MSKGRLPLRKCVGCGQMKPKSELVRVVRTTDDSSYTIDPTGKQPGRGAYVCATSECIAKAQKQRGFERSYKCGSPREIYSQLAEIPEGVLTDDI